MNELIAKNKELKTLYKSLAEISGFMWARGWAERNAGNISVNISELFKAGMTLPAVSRHQDLEDTYPELAGQWFIVTGTGSRMRDLARKPRKNTLIIRIDDDGCGYGIYPGAKEDTLLPTSELPTHLGIHRMISRRGSFEKVVMHTHVSEFIALTQSREYCNEEALNRLLWGMHPEIIIFVPKGLGFVPYHTPGTRDIAEATIQALQDHDLALWEKHGIFAIGNELHDTFDNIDILAGSARIFLMCRQAGLKPEGLTDHQLDELRKIVF